MGQASRLRVLFLGVQQPESERTSLSYPEPSEKPEPVELALPPFTSTFGPLCANRSESVSNYAIKTVLFICLLTYYIVIKLAESNKIEMDATSPSTSSSSSSSAAGNRPTSRRSTTALSHPPQEMKIR
jgi:hypothetical protein